MRFDDNRGYGFITPTGGGEDAFFHANDLGDQRDLVHAGLMVEYEAEVSDRGLKVAAVRIIDSPTSTQPSASTGGGVADHKKSTSTGEDDAMCDVIARRQFASEITEVLIQHVPSVTGSQIAQIRDSFATYATSYGWVEG